MILMMPWMTRANDMITGTRQLARTPSKVSQAHPTVECDPRGNPLAGDSCCHVLLLGILDLLYCEHYLTAWYPGLDQA